MNIVYIVFGNDLNHYLQANFSILSFLTQKKAAVSFHIITDKTEMYANLGNEVTVIEIDNEILNEWKGEFDFFWRIKIKAIQYVEKKFEGQHILYLDSDTFLFGNLSVLMEQMDEGKGFMHVCEGQWKSLKSKTEKIMWKHIYNKTYGDIRITNEYSMWNAGVIGIPGKHAFAIIDKALQVCDDMLKDNVTRRLIEQYAFSVALLNISTLQEAENHIGHYWSNKQQWNAFIGDFFIEQFLKNNSKDEIITNIKKINFAQFPVYIKKRSTNRKLKKIIDSYFPDKKEIFIPTTTFTKFIPPGKS